MNEDEARRVPGFARALRFAKAAGAVLFGLLLFDLGAMYLAFMMRPERRAARDPLDSVIAATTVGAFVLTALIVVSLVFGLVQQARLRNALQAARGLLCPGCGYNLAGVEADRCPECGRKFKGSSVVSEWRDEYATALPPWSPVDPAPQDDASSETEDRD